ncbi:MAG: helix-turn-helix domain-containing protein [Candidatus Thermoplasmatota archaeon]
MRFLDTSKNICCDDVIRCIFDFNKLDINVYKKLKEDGELKAQELAYKLKKERSTVYRSLQKLTKCGLCIKKTNKIEAGGHYHTYESIDSKLVKIKIESCINDWYKSMKNTLKVFEIE